jgi:hypothetical protein
MKIDKEKFKALLLEAVPKAPAEAVDVLIDVLASAMDEDFDGVTAAVNRFPPELLSGLSYMAGKMAVQCGALALYCERVMPKPAPLPRVAAVAAESLLTDLSQVDKPLPRVKRSRKRSGGGSEH